MAIRPADTPQRLGCALFLVSGHLALVGTGGWRFWRRRDLGWWIVAVNMQEFEHPLGPRRRRD